MHQALGASWHLVRAGFWKQLGGACSLLWSVKNRTEESVHKDTCLGQLGLP